MANEASILTRACDELVAALQAESGPLLAIIESLWAIRQLTLPPAREAEVAAVMIVVANQVRALPSKGSMRCAADRFRLLAKDLKTEALRSA